MHRIRALFVVAGLMAAPLVASAQTTNTFTYDDLGRLKTVSYPSGPKTAYSYDNADNRTKAQTALNGVMTNSPPTCTGWGFNVTVGSGTYSGQVTAAQFAEHCIDPDSDPLTVVSPSLTNGSYNYTISAGQTLNVPVTVSDGKGGTGGAMLVIHGQ